MNKKFLLSASDIPQDNWIDRWLPRSWRAYAKLARIDRPIGTWLLYLPCLWGIALAWQEMGRPLSATPLLDILQILLLFGIGAFVMRGAGCTLNDLWDRKIDSQVARTANRPLASGELMTFGAIVFLIAQLSVGLVILLQLNPTSCVLGLLVLLLVIFYPAAKRVTYWPQAVLGLTFNSGVLLGFLAVKEAISPAALLAYAAGFFWTLGYDTIYAYQDKTDDLIVGVRSLALFLGDITKPALAMFYVLTVILLIASVWQAGLGAIAYIGILLSAVNFSCQLWNIDLDNPRICLKTFLSNRNAGIIIALAIVLG
ncbi:4-hydroxybenzoate polyprenyl transferase [Candidatus Endolissoclinum faulkneri L5]|uniref:4-hydroxybenzoate octaprenyltransferase n=1 Tax=Candidatus Endolissoclinum faulkneri L5 TaxID=1401328 RepID=V9TTE8_9PROT|nr:4-hydroxybenzoate octaprenyltransferase [Candidatus Endolissoclinum faulkneri]AHC73437.1 4-hydroxybenzoate polyprenyl transferase [Candidatus Endolissoclinum faulkneri L5]